MQQALKKKPEKVGFLEGWEDGISDHFRIIHKITLFNPSTNIIQATLPMYVCM